MAEKTKSSFVPMLVVITVLALGGYFLRPYLFSTNGHKKDGDQVLFLQVSWLPARQIRVDYAIGTGDTKREDPNGRLWEKTVSVKRGTVVALFAYQDTPGTMLCRIKEGGKELAHDNNVGRGGTMANAVKCITGS